MAGCSDSSLLALVRFLTSWDGGVYELMLQRLALSFYEMAKRGFLSMGDEREGARFLYRAAAAVNFLINKSAARWSLVYLSAVFIGWQ